MPTSEQINEWVALLESDEYKQCSSKLEIDDDDGSCYFCCLGIYARYVLNARKVVLDIKEVKSGIMNAGVYFYIEHGFFKTMLPEHIMKKEMQDKLVEMNDGGRTFKDIAAYIKSQPLGAF